MTRLSLAVLGTFQATLDDHPLHFRGWKERALLAYLATEFESFHERSQLVALLWSTRSEAQGLANLRLTLSRMRQGLKDPNGNTFILVTRNGLRWNPDAPATVDIQSFRRAVESPLIATHLYQAEHSSPLSKSAGTTIEARVLEPLSNAVALYQGDFLTGFDGGGEEPFAEWSRAWRERLHQQVLTALYTVSQAALQRGDYPAAEHYAYRQLALERWREEAHRQLMQALASTGQRTAALRQYDSLIQILEEELGVSPDPATLALYEQIRDGHFPSHRESDIAPVPLTLGTIPESNRLQESYRPPTNLPTPLTPFLGREEEQAFVLNRIRERGERLVTLVGEGGIGKSRLATALGHQFLLDFPQGVWWVSLAELELNPNNPDDTLADCIARTFNLPLNGEAPVTTQVFAYLQNKQLLLILDNFESIYAAAPTVLSLLQQCPQVSILVTTREALHYQAEIILRVEGLPLPPTADPDPLTYSSVRLLVERAERTGWQLIPHRLEDISHLCRFLRGVPLALELAATLVGEVSLRTLLDELQQGYDLLATTMRDVPPRHRTMQAIFETSWQLLAPRHQIILAQLAIFRGRFDVAAAEAVAVATPSDIIALVVKSLVQQDSDGWFSLHDHLRDFAHRQWQAFDTTTANGHFSQLRESPARHAAYYLGWLATLNDPLYGDDLPITLKAIQSQRANLYQAWQWAIQQQAWALIAPAIAPLRRALHIMADLRDGVRLFDMVISEIATTHDIYVEAVAALIQFLSRIGQTGRATALVETALTRPDLPLAHHADLLRLHADLLVSGEQVNRTDAMYQRALSLAQQVEERRLETTILVSACSGAWMRNDYPYAQRYADAALPLARDMGDLWAEVAILNRLGVLAINQQYGLAIAHDYFSRGLELARLLNDRQTEGTLLSNLGIVSEYQMDFATALIAYHGGLALQNERGNLQASALSHTNVGRLFYMVGDYPTARPYLESALHLYTESNNLRGQGLAYTYLGAVLNHLDDLALATTHLEQATQIFRTLELIPFLPFALTYLGEAYSLQNDYAKAEDMLNEAAQTRRDIDDTILLKDTLALLVRLYLIQGKLDLLPSLLVELADNIDKTDDVGAEHLVADYIALYEGQRATNNPTAVATLAATRALFTKIISMMPDPAMRQAYSAIPAHRLLMEE